MQLVNDCCAVAKESWNSVPRLFLLLEVHKKMDEIAYTSLSEQIEKLKSQNLLIEDEAMAKDALNLYGYSNLIKSYRDPYIIIVDGKKVYRSGVSFNQLVSLYLLDKNLRNSVMAAMIDLEEHIKEAAADVVAHSFGTHPDDYLNFRNYSNKRKRKYRFTLAGIMETMKKALDTDKNPICHYQTEHGVVPPWILFKSIYFSTLVNYIDQFKSSQKNEIIDKIYNLKDLQLDYDSARKLMMDSLFICMEYRNLAAHGGRTYNYVCESSLRTNEIFKSEHEITISGFSQLLFILGLFKYKNPFYHLNSTLNEEVNRHCTKFPQDVTYLGQILNINIVPQTFVYITNSSNKYHLNPYCSGIKDATPLELEEAKAQNYIPCKRCCK